MGFLTTRALGVAATVLVVVGLAGRSTAIEFFEGNLEIHGFYEAQFRTIARDYSTSDGFDLTQWYNILNIETEADFAPNGFGPFDVFQGFLRLEVRYDCVWTRACGIFSSANAFGDRAKRLPKRLNDGRRAGYRPSGALFTGHVRRFAGIPREFLAFAYGVGPLAMPNGPYEPSLLYDIGGLDTLFGSRGVDERFGTWDDPAPFYFSKQLERECRFAFRKRRGSMDGVGVQIMGPWDPKCKIRPIGALSNKPDPLNPDDFNPILLGSGDPFGSGALPLRPAPELNWEEPSQKGEAQGVYFPNYRLAQQLRDGKFDAFDQNFRQEELAWNRGASQQDEKELKEAYFDIEMFDSRLWLRLGKQTVVWGKTELFRNQDQWNPQDLALASLPSLEESRIALWMGRAVWHFWDVGPLEDVRAELVVAYDQFEPIDLGRCGEPYAPNPVCNKTLGLFIHGLTGFGAAGEIRPPNPWNSWEGIELGGRFEWRWDRFSFALSDYWGYTDLPYQKTLFRYSRNVDPATGRPRRLMDTGSCTTGLEPSCLNEANALAQHSINQQLFRMICATSIGFSSLDSTACGQTVFNSQKLSDPDDPLRPRLMIALTNIVSGQNNPLTGGAAVAEGLGEFTATTIDELNALAARPETAIQRFTSNTFGANTPTVVVPLSMDPNDGLPLQPGDIPGDLLGPPITFWSFTAVQPYLTDEQEALLGCGPFYGTQCDLDGFDLMNAEASVIMQSFPGFPGTSGSFWDTRDTSLIQPGTVGFDGGPVCTRSEDGETAILPGCRGQWQDERPEQMRYQDVGYDPDVDGTTTGRNSTGNLYPEGRRHPFTNQKFASEMAVASWNTLMGLVVFSSPETAPGDPVEYLITDFNPEDPFRTDGCSFATPQLCRIVQSFFQISGIQRDTLRAGGNGRFGRRDFTWAGGKDIALRYEKRNILGFGMDFAEDFTKSNWGVEFTWEKDIHLADNNQFDGHEVVDRYNWTISVDRPTFVNFLNANRTFFINTQWFIQYVDGHEYSFPSNGPWNVLAVVAINTGFFDDRLLPSMAMVYDFGSNSGAWLPQVTYRYSANFSATFGLAVFAGREEPRPMAISPTSLSNRTGRHAYTDFAENGLSAVRDRDELFLKVRYTF
jgi:hypothetical protein